MAGIDDALKKCLEQNLHVYDQNLHVYEQNLHVYEQNLHVYDQNLHVYEQNLHVYEAIHALDIDSQVRYDHGSYAEKGLEQNLHTIPHSRRRHTHM
eukprot:489039-Rhodomonas_salina.1